MRNLRLEYKISKLEKEITNEAKQVGNLYHVCTLDAYLKYILPTDTLQSSGKYINHLYGGTDYVSFTRDKYFVVQTKTIRESNILVRLVIDGDLLSEHFKIGPYNDFVYSQFGTYTPNLDNSKIREMEEVVKGPIKNISKYIKEVQFDIKNLNSDIINELSELSRKRAMKNVETVYCNFITNKTSDTKRLIKAANIQNGTPLKQIAPLLNNALENDLEPLLFSGDINKIQKAIELGADLNQKYDNGYPLAYYAEDLIVLQLLLASGVDTSLYGNKLAILNATSYNYKDILDVVKLLLDNGIDPNTSAGRCTALYNAVVRLNNPQLVELLLKYGADVNANNVNLLGRAQSNKVYELLYSAAYKTT